MIDSFYRIIYTFFMFMYEMIVLFIIWIFFFIFVEEKELKVRIIEFWKYRESGIIKMDGKFFLIV